MPPRRHRRPTRVSTPRPPSPPRVSPLRLAPTRPGESTALDRHRTKSGLALPPFVRWDAFIRQFRWREGEHITVVGPTGSGKTVLNRNLLKRAPLKERKGQFVVVLGIKNRDRELYGPFEAEGYELVRKFDAMPDEDTESQHIIFAPQTDKAGGEGLQERSRKFRTALHDIEQAGGWTVYADDLGFMSDEMKLRTEFGLLWKVARSEGVELVGSATDPVGIPVAAYGNASHLFLFKNLDDYRAKRMAEFAGVNREIARETILRLPDHEFLYINKSSGQMLRSRVITAARPKAS